MVERDGFEVITSNKELMRLIAEARDLNAFSELFDYFAPRIKSFYLKKNNQEEQLAEDLTQEVLVQVWRNAHMYNPESAQVSTWIYTLARNIRIDSLRKTAPASVDTNDSINILSSIVDESLTPLQSIQQEQLEMTIQEYLSLLPVEQAEVIQKTFLDGKSHAEAASELQIPLGTLKSRVRLALSKLGLIFRDE
jgi:RNA polymerase sigma-70 factor (ECF subfamily)